MYYVVNARTRTTQHQDDTEQGANQYVTNTRALTGTSDPFVVVKGAKERDKVLKGKK